MTSPSLRLHDLLPYSRANGPGARVVVWLQGCTLACPSCFNPQTHPSRGGERLPVEALFERVTVASEGIEGLTVSGGEPLQQIKPLVRFLERIRQSTHWSVIVFTGYTWEEVQRMRLHGKLLQAIDVLIAGRYIAGQRLARGLLGSANKTLHFLTDRYTERDLSGLPEAEISISPEGEVLLSGIDPVRMKDASWRNCEK